MRLFVAVRPPAEAVSHLQAVLAGRRTSRPEQWHVTLAFLGEVAAAAPLSAALAAAATRHRPFALQLAGGGTFSGARVVWTGLDGGVAELSALAGDVQDAARQVGVELEGRRFRPHLTVGRSDRLSPALLADYRGPLWQVAEVELVHSVLGKAAAHSVLERFPLYQA